MKARIAVTTRTKRYKPGEEITEKLSPAYENFLLKHGYAELSPKKDSPQKPAGKAAAASDKKEDKNGLHV